MDALQGLLHRHKVVGLVGARQVGKTTLARMLAKRVKAPVSYFDLESPETLARLSDPMLALKRLRGLVILDEVQRLPDLFTVLRVLVDRPGSPLRILILGSASPELLRQSAESLAGRIVYHVLGGFSLEDVGARSLERLWSRGGFPRSYLAGSHAASAEWRRAFIKTFLERDLGQLGVTLRSFAMHRFWTMLAHYHGQVLNASELARSFGVADTTVRNYLDILTGAFVVRQLQPWHENISKRQVKAPKVYIADSGLLHALLGLGRADDLYGHPKVGASWEGFIIEQLMRRLGAGPEECFFWATHAGAQLDLLIVRGERRLGFEIKRTSSPQVTPSMRSAISDLRLKSLTVVHAGDETFPMSKGIRAVAAVHLIDELEPLG